MFRIGGITPYASGFHSQASGPSWAGALRLRFWPQVAGWYREQLCRGAHRLRQLIIPVLSTRMPLYLKCIATYEFLLGCAINAAQRLGTISIAIAITFETFALFGFDGILLPPRFLIRLGAATGARPSSGFEQGLYNRAIWGV